MVAARFAHAALYVGSGIFVHSVPDFTLDEMKAGGVKKIDLSEFLCDGKLYVILRAKIVDEEHLEAIKTSAKSQIGIPYAYTACVRATVNLVQGAAEAQKVALTEPLDETSDEVKTGRELVCSDFVYCVFDEVFQAKNPCNISGGMQFGISTPSEFFNNPNFESVYLT